MDLLIANFGRGAAAAVRMNLDRRDDDDVVIESEDESFYASRIVGGSEFPTAATRLRLSREVREPPRETMVRHGAFAVHHWVHTWLDGPDARAEQRVEKRGSSA